MPGAVRLLVFQTHYRQKLDLTDDALDAAREGARRLGEFGDRLARAPTGPGSPAETEAAQALRSLVTEAMNDDLNAPRAVAALFDFVREGNRLLDGSKSAGPELREVWAWAAQVLDVAASAGRVEVTRCRGRGLRGDAAGGPGSGMGFVVEGPPGRGQEGSQLQAG